MLRPWAWGAPRPDSSSCQTTTLRNILLSHFWCLKNLPALHSARLVFLSFPSFYFLSFFFLCTPSSKRTQNWVLGKGALIRNIAAPSICGMRLPSLPSSVTCWFESSRQEGKFPERVAQSSWLKLLWGAHQSGCIFGKSGDFGEKGGE